MWPTPCTNGVNGGSNSRKAAKARGMWPTPTSSEDAAGTPNGKMQWMLTHAAKSGCMTRKEYKEVKAKMWPTPMRRDYKGQTALTRKDGKSRMDQLPNAVAFATPQARDFRTGQQSRWDNPERSRNLNDQIAKFPTPNASDHIQRKTSKSWKEKGRTNFVLSNPEVTGVHGGQLNPTWVEWLMGWPLEWTDLKPLATDKCQQWPHWHGKP